MSRHTVLVRAVPLVLSCFFGCEQAGDSGKPWDAADGDAGVSGRLKSGHVVINDCTELQNLPNTEQTFILKSDIDCTSFGDFSPVELSGHFNGGGYKIIGLTIPLTYTLPGGPVNSVGLFSVVHPTGRISDLIIEDADVTGNDEVGIVAGTVLGFPPVDSPPGQFPIPPFPTPKIWNVAVVGGEVTGRYHVGGLVGRTIIDDPGPCGFPAVPGCDDVPVPVVIGASYSTAGVTAANQSGLLVGEFDGNLTQTYSAGTMTGQKFARLVGSLSGSPLVEDSYFDCDVAGACSDPDAVTTSQLTDLAWVQANGFDGDWNRRAPGTYVCRDFEPGCDSCGTSGDTTCDAVDDDCDNAVDEDWVVTCGDPTTVQSCVSGTIQETSCLDTNYCNGDETCSAGACQPGTPRPALPNDVTCDGIDDDCDGLFDEDFTDGNPCTSETCSGGVATITPDPASTTCPEDPTLAAPALPPGGATTVAEDVEFLYQGPGAYQSSVQVGAIDPEKAVRLYGEVGTIFGTAMGGVHIGVAGHPELGHVYSRADGRYDFVANPGRVTLEFTHDGHPTVHRTVVAPVNEHTWVPDVVMTPLDVASHKDLSGNSTTVEVHLATPVTDADGTRQARLFFMPGTIATMEMPNGTTGHQFADPSQLDVSATEFTVGSLGPDAMPAPMPPQIMYTYAIELSIAQAESVGAHSVHFSERVSFYMENFVDAPIGMLVPAGYYDRRATKWVPERDGVVLEVLGFNSLEGRADLDIDGDGAAESLAELTEFGFREEELDMLLSQYSAGTELWWVPMSHFSARDLNTALEAPDARAPDAGVPNADGENCTTNVSGSIIHCESRALAERVPVVGTSLSLRYQSDRVQSARHKRVIRHLVTDDGASGPAGRIGASASVYIAGRRLHRDFGAVSGRTFNEVEWDGLDWAGRLLTRPVRSVIDVCHDFAVQPAARRYDDTGVVSVPASFGRNGATWTRMFFNRAASKATACTAYLTQRRFGVVDTHAEQQLGGLGLDVRHTLTSDGQTLIRGSGSRQDSLDQDRVSTLIASDLDGTWLDDNPTGIGVTEASLAATDLTRGVAVANDGTVYVHLESNGPGVYRVEQDGTLTRVAGNGDEGAWNPALHENALATDVPLRDVSDVAVSPAGDLIIAQAGRVLAVNQAGTIGTVYGMGETSGQQGADDAQAGEGLDALQVLAGSLKVAFTADGRLVVYDNGFGRIRVVHADGRVETLAGGPGTTLAPNGDQLLDNEPARLANLPQSVRDIAVHPLTDEVYFTMESQVVRISNDGRLFPVTGDQATTGVPLVLADVPEDGTPASELPPEHQIDRIAFSPSGRLHILGEAIFGSSGEGNRNDWVVWIVDANDKLQRLAGLGPLGPPFDSTSASEVQLGNNADAMTVGLDGTVYVAGTYLPEGTALSEALAQVHAIRPTIAGADGMSFVDGSGLRHFFDAFGRHDRTTDAVTGTLVRQFIYENDGAKRVQAIEDAHGNRVDFTYAANEVRISPPFGPDTIVTLNGGWVDEVYYESDPDHSGDIGAAGFEFDPAAEGLLRTFNDRRGNEHLFTYGALGWLETDTDVAAGTSWTLSAPDSDRIPEGTQYEVTLQSGEGRARVHQGLRGYDGRNVNVVTDFDGTQTTTTRRMSGGQVTSATVERPDGSTVQTELGPDQHLGWGMPVARSSCLTLPSGMQRQSQMERQYLFFDETTGEPTNVLTSSVAVIDDDCDPETPAVSRRIRESHWARLPNGTSDVLTRSAEGRKTLSRYDQLGQLIWNATVDDSGVAVGYPTWFTYDGRGRLISMVTAPETSNGGPPDLTDPTKVRQSTFAFDPTDGWLSSQSTTISPTEQATTAFGRDLFGRATNVTRNSVTLGMDYDVMGLVDEVTPPGRGTHGTAYSERNELESYDPPMLSDVGFTPTSWAPGTDWAEAGPMTLPTGQQIVPSYDMSTGRLDTLTVGGVGTYTYDYAPMGAVDTGQLRVVTTPAQFGGATVSTEWDYDGPLTTQERTDVTHPMVPTAPWAVQFERDPLDELWLERTSVSVAGGSPVEVAEYEYDDDGLLTRAGPMVVVPDQHRGTLGAACAGNATPVTSGGEELDCSGNVRTAVTLNDFGEPEEIDTSWTGGELDFEFSYDLAGRIDTITEVVDGVPTVRQYHYDLQGRLEEVTDPGNGDATVYGYEYDDNGNRIGWNKSPTDTCAAPSGTCAVYDEQDRMREYNEVEYQYDDHGTLLTRDDGGAVTSFDYDAQGHLRHVDMPDGGEIDYLIDGVGRRVGRAVDGDWDRFWIYKDGLNPIAQLNEDGDLEMLFIYALQPHVPSMVVVLTGVHAGTYRVVTDQVGSVRRLVNIDTGDVELAVDYSPFGEIVSEGGDLLERFPFRFAGGLWDEATGLIRFGARDYDPTVGRWTAKDPALFGGDTSNLYQYSHGQPHQYVDPNGRIPWFVVPIIAGAVSFIIDLAAQGFETDWEWSCMSLGSAAIAGVAGAASAAFGWGLSIFRSVAMRALLGFAFNSVASSTAKVGQNLARGMRGERALDGALTAGVLGGVFGAFGNGASARVSNYARTVASEASERAAEASVRTNAALAAAGNGGSTMGGNVGAGGLAFAQTIQKWKLPEVLTGSVVGGLGAFVGN